MNVMPFPGVLCDLRQFVDHAQSGSGEDRAGPVEFVAQPCGVAAVPRIRPRRMPFSSSGTIAASDRNSSARGRRGRRLTPWASATAGIIPVSAR